MPVKDSEPPDRCSCLQDTSQTKAEIPSTYCQISSARAGGPPRHSTLVMLNCKTSPGRYG